jgi:hypothetical protein
VGEKYENTLKTSNPRVINQKMKGKCFKPGIVQGSSIDVNGKTPATWAVPATRNPISKKTLKIPIWIQG